jgi:AraC-like DNA-binding protein
MNETIADLASTVAQESQEGLTPTAMPNVGLYKVSRCIDLLPEIYRPVVSLILQGEKQLLIGNQVLTYRAGQTFTAALDLPVLAKISEASTDRPYLAISLAIDPGIVSDLVLEMPDLADDTDRKGFGVSAADPELLDAWGRTLRLIKRPDEVRIMAPLLEREIVFRLLRGPQGAILRQFAAADATMSQIRKALTSIEENYAGTFRVEDIARSVSMSPSAFHRRFKAATGMAPLQYQKTLRLYEARRLLLTEPASASSAAFSVGYQSVSQFSREYRRMFGTPPMREIRMGRSDPPDDRG